MFYLPLRSQPRHVWPLASDGYWPVCTKASTEFEVARRQHVASIPHAEYLRKHAARRDNAQHKRAGLRRPCRILFLRRIMLQPAIAAANSVAASLGYCEIAFARPVNRVTRLHPSGGGASGSRPSALACASLARLENGAAAASCACIFGASVRRIAYKTASAHARYVFMMSSYFRRVGQQSTSLAPFGLSSPGVHLISVPPFRRRGRGARRRECACCRSSALVSEGPRRAIIAAILHAVHRRLPSGADIAGNSK